jgi:hypothetical protein
MGAVIQCDSWGNTEPALPATPKPLAKVGSDNHGYQPVGLGSLPFLIISTEGLALSGVEWVENLFRFV